MWTNLILAWLAMNVVLVLLLWRRSILLSRREEQHFAAQQSSAQAPSLIHHKLQRVSSDAEAANAGRRPDNKSRVVVVVSGDTKESPRLPPEAPPATCNGLNGFNATRFCRFMEMQAEIRELHLVVAELSLERARLSSAIARRRC